MEDERNGHKNIGLIIIIVLLAIIGATILVYTIYERISDSNKNRVVENEEENTNVKMEDYMEEQMVNGKTYTITYTFTADNYYDDSVPIEDKIAFSFSSNTGRQLYLLDGGNIYYTASLADDGDYSQTMLSFDNSSDIQRLYSVSNVKRIKSFLASNSSYRMFLILESGDVNILSYKDKRVTVEPTAIFPDGYEIDDIEEYKDDVIDSWVVILKNGTKFEKEVKLQEE